MNREKHVLIDVGSNSGYFSEYVLNEFSSINVIAIEPNPEFEKNLIEIRNQFENRFKFINKALWITESDVDFYVPEASNGQLGSLLAPNPLGEWDSYIRNDGLDSIKVMKVKSFSTTQLAKLAGQYQFKIIKLDTQGMDIKLADKLLSEITLNILILEIEINSNNNDNLYLNQENSMLELLNLVTKYNLSIYKAYPNSQNLIEFNIVLLNPENDKKIEKEYLDLLIKSPVLKRFSRIIGIGETSDTSLGRFFLRLYLNFFKLKK